MCQHTLIIRHQLYPKCKTHFFSLGCRFSLLIHPDKTPTVHYELPSMQLNIEWRSIDVRLTHTYMHTLAQTRTHTHMHIRTHTHVHSCTRTNPLLQIDRHTVHVVSISCVHTHTRARTHTYFQACLWCHPVNWDCFRSRVLWGSLNQLNDSVRYSTAK